MAGLFSLVVVVAERSGKNSILGSVGMRGTFLIGVVLHGQTSPEIVGSYFLAGVTSRFEILDAVYYLGSSAVAVPFDIVAEFSWAYIVV